MNIFRHSVLNMGTTKQEQINLLASLLVNWEDETLVEIRKLSRKFPISVLIIGVYDYLVACNLFFFLWFL